MTFQPQSHTAPAPAGRLAAAAALAILVALGAPAAGPKPSPVDSVEPRIDTHNSRWFFFSSACRPFGMVNLSPDTQTDGDWGAGYLYGDHHIRGFSHIHDWQLAGVPVMPLVGRMSGAEGSDVYKSAFSHDKEVVKPGYHKVLLEDYAVTAELTSTKRVGFHRYSFPASRDAYLLFDVGAKLGPSAIENARLRRVNARELAGFATLAPTPRRKKSATVYFVAQLDHDSQAFGGWQRDGATGKRQLVSGPVAEVAGPD